MSLRSYSVKAYSQRPIQLNWTRNIPDQLTVNAQFIHQPVFRVGWHAIAGGEATKKISNYLIVA